MRSLKYFAYFLIAFAAGYLSFALPSHAADYSAGDPCSASGAFHTTNDANGVDMLVCDGSNWRAAISYFSAGGLAISSLTGQPAPQYSSSGASGSGMPIIDFYAAIGTVDPVTISATSDTWPDYILCDAGNITVPLHLAEYNSASNFVWYYNDLSAGYQFGTDGSFLSRATVDANCGASSGDIDTICSEDRCGFFGGSSGGSGGASPGGADTHIQFNDGGSALGGDADFVWNKTANKLTVTGDIDYTGVLTDTSDRRLKENVAPLKNSLARITALQGVSFTMKNDEQALRELGFIAQDVEPHFPSLVHTKQDGLKTLNYIGLIAPLVEAVKEQQAIIEKLEAANADLEARLQRLEEQGLPK